MPCGRRPPGVESKWKFAFLPLTLWRLWNGFAVRIMAIYNSQMDISVTEFKQRCLEIIRSVEQTGRTVTITRRGRAVASLRSPAQGAGRAPTKPWEALRALGGRLLAAPGESVLRDKDFDALS
jgi:prevent-host-death family protein